MVFQTNVNNIGSASTTDAKLTVNVYQAPNLTTPIQSYTSSLATIAASANSTLTAGTFTPSSVGTYVCKFISSCTGNTSTTADTTTYMFSVDNKEYSRDNSTVTSSFGIGAGPTGYIGSMYTINAATTMDSVIIALVKPGSGTVAGDGVGDSTRVTIFDVASGIPNAIIGQSPAYVFTPADTLGLVVTQHSIKDLSGSPLALTPGVYFVAITEYNTNVGVAVCDGIFKNTTVFAGWTGQPFTAVETFGASFAKTPVIRPSFVTCVTPTVTVNSGSICSGNSFTMVPSGAASYSYSSGSSIVSPTTTVSYTVTGNNNGCTNTAVSTVTVNSLPTVSASSSNTLLCTGENATLTATGNSTSYAWSTSETTASIVVAPTSQTTYTVVGFDSNGCSNMAVVTENVNLCTGIAQNTLANEFVVYPNPSNGIFNINISSTYNVTVSDVLGKVVYSAQLENGTHAINLNNYSNGLYILKAESNGQSKTLRLVKN